LQKKAESKNRINEKKGKKVEGILLFVIYSLFL
jgi:hypothetical protein